MPPVAHTLTKARAKLRAMAEEYAGALEGLRRRLEQRGRVHAVSLSDRHGDAPTGPRKEAWIAVVPPGGRALALAPLRAVRERARPMAAELLAGRGPPRRGWTDDGLPLALALPREVGADGPAVEAVAVYWTPGHTVRPVSPELHAALVAMLTGRAEPTDRVRAWARAMGPDGVVEQRARLLRAAPGDLEERVPVEDCRVHVRRAGAPGVERLSLRTGLIVRGDPVALPVALHHSKEEARRRGRRLDPPAVETPYGAWHWRGGKPES